MATMTDKGQPNHILQRWMTRNIILNWEVIVYVIILCLAIFTRFYGLGDRVMSHDESLHTRFSWNLYNDGDFNHTPLMHGPILFHATAFSYFIFGDNDFSSRIYPALLGVLLILTPILFRRWLGRWGSVLASTMLLISPLLLYYNRYIRHDTPSILSAVLMAWAMMMYTSGPERLRGKGRWLYLVAVSMIWNLGSKETAFFYIFLFGVFLAIYWFVRLLQHYRSWSGKLIFYVLMMGIMMGATLALPLYTILDIIPAMVVPGSGTPFNELAAADQSSLIIWISLSIFALAALIVGTAVWVYRDRPAKVRWSNIFIILVIALVVALGLLVLEELSHVAPVAEAVVDGETVEIGSTIRWIWMIALWLVFIGVSILLLLSRAPRVTQDGDKKRVYRDRFGFWEAMKAFPEFDLIIVIGTLILPWATAIIPYLMKPSSTDFAQIGDAIPAPISQLLANVAGINGSVQVGQVMLGFAAWLPLFLLSVMIGLSWNWKRWLISATFFYSIFAFFFTTVFTNIAGLGTGMVYSLGYWLEQQGVRRGSQPQYYYLLIILPVYEYLPIVGSVLAMISGTTVFWRWQRSADDAKQKLSAQEYEYSQQKLLLEESALAQEIDTSEDIIYVEPLGESLSLETVQESASRWGVLTRLDVIPFLIFISWWAVLNLAVYSLAGEKMPWLGTHMTTPMILMSGWFFGMVFEKISWAKFTNKGWFYCILFPLAFVLFFQLILPFFWGQGIFSGLQQEQLRQTGSWFALLIAFGITVYGIYRIMLYTGFAHLRRMFIVLLFVVLSVLTFRTAWLAAFINYDYATEFLVYAHAAPAIKWVLDDIDDMSRRVTDGNSLRFAYDNEVSWPYSWYFRDYPNAVFVGANPTVQSLDDAIVVVVGSGNRSKVEPILEDRYIRYDYQRLWWPMQEYFYLNTNRVLNALDFSPENTNAALIRKGMFDIWWSRDYTTYGQAIGKDFSPTNWPVADRMHVYIRKDYASQIWPYGVGDGVLTNPLDQLDQNSCTANWMDVSAVTIFDETAVTLNRPLGMTIDDENKLYVAEEFAHRISVFDAENGLYIKSLGSQGAANLDVLNFMRPNSIKYDPISNSFFISDTWNYRIVQISPEGEIMTTWGQAGEFGWDAPSSPTDGFWGPRDLAIDADGFIYVADTGNKRVRSYQLIDGTALLYTDIGKGGSGLGELDEPSSVVVHSDGRVFVADYWNRRISIFDKTGQFLMNYPVKGWYEELGNRPFLALDEARDQLYVTDPDSGRVLIYDTLGNCLGAFGQVASESPSANTFQVVGGITVDSEGYVYVADAGFGRILKFAPFELAHPNTVPDTVEVTPELEVELTEELTPELEFPESESDSGGGLEIPLIDVPESTAEPGE